MNAPRARIKRGKASLIGGIAVGVATLVLWLAVTRELGFASAPVVGLGMLVAACVAAWIRIADL